MNNILITVDKKNGKLLVVTDANNKRYFYRDKKASDLIKKVAKIVKINRVVSGDNKDRIYGKDYKIIIDSEDNRMYSHAKELTPLTDKIMEFINKEQRKEKISSNVLKRNVLSRKILSSNPNYQSNMIRKSLRNLRPGDMEKIITSNVNKKLIKVAATGTCALIMFGSLIANAPGRTNESPNVVKADTTPYKTEYGLSDSELEERYREGFTDVKPSDIDFGTKEEEEIDEHQDEVPIVYEQEEDPQEVQFDGIYFDYPNRCDDDKYKNCKANYLDLIYKYANMYGVDPKIALGIATQERGVHGSYMDDGGATGLFQIQNDVWIGNNIEAYNQETNTIDSIRVTYENIGDLETNIRLGCMVLSSCYEQMNGNIMATIMCYHYGIGFMGRVLNSYAEYKGLMSDGMLIGDSVRQILSDPKDIGWTDERFIVIRDENGNIIGDPYYLQHIFSYVEGDENTITFLDNDGIPSSLTVRNSNAYQAEYSIGR